jgi:hypothetical protein
VNKLSKITIKFFLKESLSQGEDEHGNKIYPLYIMITYQRKNTQIKSKYSEHVYTRMDDVEKFSPGLMAFEEKILRKVLEYEIAKFGEDNFSLVGIGRKYDLYATSVYQAIEPYLKAKLRKAIQKTRDELQMVLQYDTAQATFSRLYKASTLLFKNFDASLSPDFANERQAYQTYLKFYPEVSFSYDFPTIIEWENKEFKATLTHKYAKAFKKKNKTLDAIFLLIDSSVKFLLNAKKVN